MDCSWTKYVTLLIIVCLTTTESVSSHNEIIRSNQINRNNGKYHIEGPYFKDAKGRIRLFHGFNAVEKAFPWYPAHLLNNTKLGLYRDWGFNVVRLGTMWAGAQPSERYFNQTYLNIMSDIIGRLQEYGINVILDMHQDCLSSKFNAYDGVPQWLVDKLPPPDHPFPWPLPKELQWSDGYITEAVSEAFQAIYNNTSGARDDLAAFWQRIAQEFKRFDNILGYELFNEPWAGDVYHDITLLIPGNAGKKNLKPLYDRLNAAIRKVDPDGIIFYEPVTWGVFFNGTATGSGFESVPGGSEYQNKSCLAYHYYCWALGVDQHQRYGSLTRAICDKTLGPLVFKAIKDDIKVTGGASFLTEFGLCDPDGSANSTATQECAFVLEQADQHFQSWTYWDASFFNGTTGGVNENVVKAFARIYPRAIAGIPRSFHFDPKSRVFEMTYTMMDRAAQSPSEIFVPMLQYPNGFRVAVSEGLKWYFDVASQVLSVWRTENNRVHQTPINCSVQIVPFE